MNINFDEVTISKKFRKFFQRRKSLRLNEDFMVCVFLILVITYRFRFIHPRHIAEVFSCTEEFAWEFADKLVKRGYLTVKQIDQSNIGFLINGKGTYLFAIGRKGVALLKEYGIENCTGRRSKARASSNLFHDMVALFITLKNSDTFRVLDFYPDYYVGKENLGSQKKPDIYILNQDQNIIWIEIERTLKSGKRLGIFFSNLLLNLYHKNVEEVHIFVPPRRNVVYENTWGNDAFILENSINGMEYQRDDPESPIYFFHAGKANLQIHQSKYLNLYRLFQGEKPAGLKLIREKDPVK